MSHKRNKSQSQYKFTFSRNQKVGQPAAESENDFSNVFVDTPSFNALIDIMNPQCIIIGRTGVGKSALIRRVEETQHKVKRISPEEMSIRFLSNSTILDYLRSVGVNLNFFYKILWKHVFIVELINLYVGDNEQKRMTFFEKIKEGFTGEQKKRKQKAILYLQEFSNDFWEATEVRVKGFEKTLETNLSKELGIQSSIFKASVSDINKQISAEQSEIKYKAEKVINELQAERLFEIIKIFKEEIFTDYQKQYFIVVDDLDRDWVSQQIVYDLIASMVEVVQDFQTQFKGVKIVLSLRDNLHMLAISGSEHRGGQREKFAALDLNLIWNEEELVELLNKRLKHLTDSKLSSHNLFEREYKNEGLKYILERTYMRPRALISFVNKIIEQAEKKAQFSRSLIKKAEPYYSTERMHAIDDEWNENYGQISKICSFLNGINNNKEIESLTEDNFENLYLIDGFQNNFKGRLFEICNNVKDEKISFEQFRMELLFILFQVGVIGIKIPDRQLLFYYDQDVVVRKEDFKKGAKFSVHKALYSYFKVNTREQEDDRFSN